MLQSVSQTKTLRIESYQATKSNPKIKRRILSLRGVINTGQTNCRGSNSNSVFKKSWEKKDDNVHSHSKKDEKDFITCNNVDETDQITGPSPTDPHYDALGSNTSE